MTNKLLTILGFAIFGNLFYAEASKKTSGTDYQKMIKKGTEKYSKKVGKSENIKKLKSLAEWMEHYPDYDELSGYLATVLNNIEDNKKNRILRGLIRRFLYGYLDSLLKDRFTEEDLSRFRKKIEKENEKKSSEESSDPAGKWLAEYGEVLVECLNKAYDRGYANGWSFGEWRIHWAVVLLYATNFVGLDRDIVENIRFNFDGWIE